MQLLLASKHKRKHIHETFSNIKIAHLQRQQYQPRNDHHNSTSRNALDCLTGMARRGSTVMGETHLVFKRSREKTLIHCSTDTNQLRKLLCTIRGANMEIK